MRALPKTLALATAGLHGHRSPVRNRRSILSRTASSLLSLLVVLGSWSSVAASQVEYDRSTLVVKLAPIANRSRNVEIGNSGRADFDQVMAELDVQRLRQTFPPLPATHRNAALAASMRMADFLTVGVPNGVDPDTMKKRLASLPGVESVEFDVIVYATSPTVTPTDPRFATYQYPLRNTGTQPPADPGTAGADMEMEAAWAHTTGDSSVILAIVDTGIDFDHPDLMDRMWYNLDEGLDGIDEDNNGFASDWRGWNFISQNNNPDDDHSHGTHCAGIAGASANNGIGGVGVDWQCKLMAVKVLNSEGSGSASAVAAGITYAADNGADVISMSLGSDSSSSDEQAAVNYADALGVTIVAAMGNDNVSTPHFPAAFPKTIAIGATDSDDRRALPLCGSPGSNYGDYIDVVAAGNWVYSTVPLENGSYGYKCGTSMATPHVAGMAALIKALRPAFTPAEVRAHLRATAEDQVGRATEDTPGFDIYHGWGRINGRIALQALTTAFPPIVSVPGPQTVTELETLVFVVTGSDSNFTPVSLSAEAFPNATFVDSGNGTGTFTLVPDILQSGVYEVAFIASDGALDDTALVSITIEDGCLCPYQGDLDADGFVNAIDISLEIDVVFFGGFDPQDSGCSTTRGDVTCDGFTTAEDLAIAIDHVFFGGVGPCDPCQP